MTLLNVIFIKLCLHFLNYSRDARAKSGFTDEKLQEIVHKTGPPPLEQLAPDFQALTQLKTLESDRTLEERNSRTKSESREQVRFEASSESPVENVTSVVKFGFS